MSDEPPADGEVIDFDEATGKGRYRLEKNVVVTFQKDPYGRLGTAGLSLRGLPEVFVDFLEGTAFSYQVDVGLKVCAAMVSHGVPDVGDEFEIEGPDGPLIWIVEPVKHDEELVLVPVDGASPQSGFTTEYGDTTAEEAYFLEQLELGTTNLIACGYLTTPIRYGSKFQTMGDAFKARSAFLALTNGALHLVHTRTPATSKPLLENQGTQVVARGHIFNVQTDGESMVLDLGHESLAFEPKLENKWFPSQKRLIERLLALDDSAPSIDALERLRLKAKLKRYWPLAMALVIAFVILLLEELEIWI